MNHQLKSPIGLYGKLPAHGDFIERNLSRAFVDAWDNWLQQSILSSQSQLNEHWLNTYMTSPIWRFALSPGCLDQHPWLGVTLPSVDSVGRYFPLTLAAKLPPNTPLFQAMQDQQAWFDTIETIALACLDEQPTIDEVMTVLKNHPLIVEAKSKIETQDQADTFSSHPQRHSNPFTTHNQEGSTLSSQASEYDPLYESLIANSVDASQVDLAAASAFNKDTAIKSLDDTQAFHSQELQSISSGIAETVKKTSIASKHSSDWAITEAVGTNRLFQQSLSVESLSVESQSSEKQTIEKQERSHQDHTQALANRMIDTLMAQKYASYSLWQTKGSDLVNSSFLCSHFLPQPSYFFAMMSGTWGQIETT